MPSCRFRCRDSEPFNLFQPCVALLRADENLYGIVKEQMGLQDEVNDLAEFVLQVVLKSINRTDGGLVGRIVSFIASRAEPHIVP